MKPTYPMLNYRLGNSGQEEMLKMMQERETKVEEPEYMISRKGN